MDISTAASPWGSGRFPFRALVSQISDATGQHLPRRCKSFVEAELQLVGSKSIASANCAKEEALRRLRPKPRQIDA
ncbi:MULTISPECIES: hypothetical protein [Novosphingobium]|uniref:hypothetical protein n=1 Tax=Novosphingobium TaxID=165696 RepID=UPI001CD4621C|nr:hypothetical protein [Novosphingobium percolationis]MCH7628430.1 hypothetical protein [Pseudomonadota bacterium]